MAGDSEMEDILLRAKVLEAEENRQGGAKKESAVEKGEIKTTTPVRKPKSCSSIDGFRAKRKSITRSPGAERPTRSKNLSGAGEPTTSDEVFFVSASGRRTRSSSGREGGVRSPGRAASQTPQTRRSIKKIQYFGAEDREAQNATGHVGVRRQNSKTMSGSETARNKSPLRDQSQSPNTKKMMIVRRVQYWGNGSERTETSTSVTSPSRRPRSLSGSGRNFGKEGRANGGLPGGSGHIRERLHRRERLLGNADSTVLGSSHIRDRASSSLDRSKRDRTQTTERRGSSHGSSSQRRERLLGNADIIPRGSNRGSSNEEDQLSDSNPTTHRRDPDPLTVNPSYGPRISWKSDPRASFCDWRIDVVHLSPDGHVTDVIDVYNIHRNVVGFGSRKSNLMCKQFIRQVEDQNYGAGSNITTIELPSQQAEVFPMVLDFIYYTTEVTQKLTAEKACHVFLIAGILDIPPLEDAIDNFFQKTISWKTMTEFLTAATQCGADRLLATSRVKLGSLVMESPTLAGLIPPKFLIDLLVINKEQVQRIQLETPELYPESLRLSQARIWSGAAYICAMHNSRQMDRDAFDAMTDEECLPAIDPKVALKFILMELSYYPMPPTREEEQEYTSLQRRCISSITENWKVFSSAYSSWEDLDREMSKLPPRILNDVRLSDGRNMQF